MSQEIRNEAQRLKPSILERHKNQCYVCGFNCRPVLVLHHIEPVHTGGNNNQSNIVVLCPNCHAIVHRYMAYALQIENESINIEFGPDSLPDELREIYYWTLDLKPEQHERLYSLARMRPLEIEEDTHAWDF